MTLTLDAQLEQQIQREIELGHGRNALEVIKRALDLAADESWSDEEKAELDARLDQSEADIEAGRVYSADEAARLLDQGIAERALKRAS